jgi:hypothetical protein
MQRHVISTNQEGMIGTAPIMASLFVSRLSANSATPNSTFVRATSDLFIRRLRMSGARVRTDKVSLSQRPSQAALFAQLAAQWKRETGHLSSALQKARHPAYLRIMAMGPDAIPLLLNQLRAEGDMPHHWFVALVYVTGGENPVPDSDHGDVRKMRDAWLRWGVTNGYGA